MFRFFKRRSDEMKTELLAVNGWDIILKTNKSIDYRSKKTIATYAISTINDKKHYDSVEALISLDFFKGMADVKISKFDDDVIEIIIRTKK